MIRRHRSGMVLTCIVVTPLGLGGTPALAYPRAYAAEVSRVAYGLASLVEAHWYFHLQGLDADDHRRYPQQSAHAAAVHVKGLC